MWERVLYLEYVGEGALFGRVLYLEYVGEGALFRIRGRRCRTLLPAGYTLKELQLYKDLKAQLDSQLAQQGREMSSLQDHYSDCLKQLQRVEKLGFQATLLPSPAYSLDTDHV